MRRLKVVPCTEPWSDMRSDGEGTRWCERCSAQVSAVAELDADRFDGLVRRAKDERVCMRFELERGRPKLASGLAAGVLVLALSGCTSLDQSTVRSPSGDSILLRTIIPMIVDYEPLEDADSEIVGEVRDSRTGQPIEGAVIVLTGKASASSLRVRTDAAGAYRFAGLAAGNYIVTVDRVTSGVSLGSKVRARASFEVFDLYGPIGASLVQGYVYTVDDGFSSPGPYLVDKPD